MLTTSFASPSRGRFYHEVGQFYLTIGGQFYFTIYSTGTKLENGPLFGAMSIIQSLSLEEEKPRLVSEEGRRQY
jgi:hypothetical protein